MRCPLVGGSDLPASYRVLTIEPGPHYAFTGADGSYWKDLPEGSYTIAQTLNDEIQICPVNTPVPFDVDALSPMTNVDFYNVSTIPHDLSVSLYAFPVALGTPTMVNIFITNNSAFYSGDVTLNFSYPAFLLNPSITGPLSIGTIPPYGEVMMQFTAYVSPDVTLLGQPFFYEATVINTANEPNTANNHTELMSTVLGAFDPNDKHGAPSSGIGSFQYFLNVDQWLDYTIRFQNTGTAAASTVVLRDTLDTHLSIGSIEILGASHTFTPSFGDERELVFTFNNINLPDSGSDLLGSQGYVAYRIKPENDVLPGDMLENTAAIYFDLNPPIMTGTTSHLVDIIGSVGDHTQTGTIAAWPNPTGDHLNVLLQDPQARIVGLFNMSGERVRPPFAQRGNSTQWDVRDLPAGIYAVNTTIGSVRFVKK